MNTLHIRTMIAVASLTLSVAAYGQQKLQATVPFEFKVGKKTLPAGNYTVQKLTSAMSTMLIRGADAGGAMLVTPRSSVRANETYSKMVFQCRRDGCSLWRVWSDSVLGYEFATPKVDPGESESVASIALAPVSHAGQ